ncbi:MAG: SlyX family protein [Alphaproteobacteria bacterium]|nr:SlyX family protein [Alphaproteobacteria bacterium]
MLAEELDKRLVELEISVTYMQKSLAELSDVVVKQGKMIELLERKNALLQSALDADLVKPLSEETPPPHY